MAQINIDLNSQDIEGMIKKLEKLKKEYSKLEQEIPNELAKLTSEQISMNYDAKGFDNLNPISPSIGYEKKQNSYIAYARSENIAYEEFGTGDVGASSSHPSKDTYSSKLGLNAYNSGPTIKEADLLSAQHGINDGMYWVYNGIYTQGIPSGNFMFNSVNWLKDNYKQITKEKVDDAISKVF